MKSSGVIHLFWTVYSDHVDRSCRIFTARNCFGDETVVWADNNGHNFFFLVLNMVVRALVFSLLAGSVAAENAACTNLKIQLNAGLCNGSIFAVQVCTGSNPIFKYTSLQSNNWVQNQTQTLSEFTSKNCPAGQTCSNLLPGSTVRISILLGCTALKLA